MRRISCVIMLGAASIMLSACGNAPPSSAYGNRGGPESLLDLSSEIVTLPTATAQDRLNLAQWVEKDMPTRAQLNCGQDGKACTEARKILELSGVPIEPSAGVDGTVTLMYERILVRDCNPRYINNTNNFHNTNHRSFGCATAANMVRHVTDKQSLVNPALSDDPSAVRAINDLKRAYKPRDIVKPYSVEKSQTTKLE